MKNSDYTYDYFLEAFNEAKKTASNLTESVSEEVFRQKPANDKWCMGEILSHLVEAGNEYASQIKKGLDKPDDRLRKGKEPFTPSFVFRWFIGQVSPENRRKLPTVPSFEPVQAEQIKKQEVLNDFLKLQDKLIHFLKKAKLEGLDLDRVRSWNPVLKIVPMSLTAFFGVLDAHQRRHFEQMKELRDRFEQ